MNLRPLTTVVGFLQSWWLLLRVAAAHWGHQHTETLPALSAWTPPTVSTALSSEGDQALVAADGSVAFAAAPQPHRQQWKPGSDLVEETTGQNPRALLRRETAKAWARGAVHRWTGAMHGPGPPSHLGRSNSSTLVFLEAGKGRSYEGVSLLGLMQQVNPSAWGFWSKGVGGKGGAEFEKVCPKGAFIYSLDFETGQHVNKIGPAMCSDGHKLDGAGNGGGEESRLSARWGWNSYSAKAGDRVNFLCLPSSKNCQGGGSGGHRRRRVFTKEHSYQFRCPRGSKVAGYGGRAGGLVDQIRLFCGCPKGTAKIGTMCKKSVDCFWDEWKEWEDCSKTCGGGHRLRTRHVGREPRFGGKKCEGPQREEGECASRACPTTTVATTTTTTTGSTSINVILLPQEKASASALECRRAAILALTFWGVCCGCSFRM
mmetsp:Transcript_33555/g.78014  ORF Transcript_33555/g.78014 Transcript_33555/m.78014 type:complete len:429 (-) Transcript_33555:84-1370(-)